MLTSLLQGESASLKRARAPYQIRNWVTGGAIVAFIAGVYLYSISAVKQDDFVSLPTFTSISSIRH